MKPWTRPTTSPSGNCARPSSAASSPAGTRPSTAPELGRSSPRWPPLAARPALPSPTSWSRESLSARYSYKSAKQVREPVLPSSTKFRREKRRRWKMWTAEDRERYKDDGRRYPSDLTDAEWELVRSLFETYRTLTRDIRTMVDGCLYLGAEGCRWRARPTALGPRPTGRG